MRSKAREVESTDQIKREGEASGLVARAARRRVEEREGRRKEKRTPGGRRRRTGDQDRRWRSKEEMREE